MIKQIQKLLFVLLALIPFMANAFESEAEYAIIQDFDTGVVLYEKRSQERLFPSSMSKMLTLYFVFNNIKNGSISMTDMVPISENAWRTGGSKMFVRVNEEVQLEDLIRGIAVQSGNDACIAIAEWMAGSEEVFAEQLNKTARNIGMKNSNFANSTGLPNENHYSTAQDLALLAKHLITDFPEYYHYFAESQFRYNNITQSNRNLLLNTVGVDGLKTGFTDLGGYGITISAKRNDQRVIVVINGLHSEKERKTEGEKLLNYAFGNFNRKLLYTANSKVMDLPLIYSKHNLLPVGCVNNAYSISPKMSDPANAKIVYQSPIQAPIKAGDTVAQLVLAPHSSHQQRIDLVALEDRDNDGTYFAHVMQNIKLLFGRKE